MPELIAEVTTAEADAAPSPDAIVLTLHKTYKRKSLGEASRHIDPVSTMLEPKPVGGDSTVYWLVGYGLETHDQPGDTRVTYALLLEVPEGGASVQALWWENHMEVPTSLFEGEGTLKKTGASAEVELKLTHTEYGESLTVSGVVRGLPEPRQRAR